jgi:hypothetical protein
MQVTFDSEHDTLERVIAVIQALYGVELQFDEAEGFRKMRH